MTPRQFIDDKVELVVYRFIDVIKKKDDYIDECWSYIYQNVAEFLASRKTLTFSLSQAIEKIHQHSRANPNPNAAQVLDFGHPDDEEFTEAFAAYFQHIIEHSDFLNLPTFCQNPCFQTLCDHVLADGIERKNYAFVVEPGFVSTFEHINRYKVPQIIWLRALNELNRDEGTRILTHTSHPDGSDLTRFFAHFLDKDQTLARTQEARLGHVSSEAFSSFNCGL